MPANTSRTRVKDLQRICSEVGLLIKGQRQALGFSQEELAYRSGLHRTYITDIERGTRNLSIESMRKLTNALGISISGLFLTIEGGGIKPENGRGHIVDIILVEDDPVDADMTIKALRNNNLVNNIRLLKDGAEAIDFLIPKRTVRPKAGVGTRRLILLDLKLPKVDGLEVLARLRRHEATKEIPVVVLTSSTSDDDMREATRLGVTNYLVKPVDFVKFSQIIPQSGLAWAVHSQNGG